MLDDSTRHQIFWIFFTLTVIVLPIWWWSTAVPRANLRIPIWNTPHRLTRLSRLQLVLVAPQHEAWRDFTNMRISPLGRESGGTVEVDDHVEVHVRVLRTAPVEASTIRGEEYVERVTAALDRPDDHWYQLIVVEGQPEEKPMLWLHPRRKSMVLHNAAGHERFADPQMFLEQVFSRYFALLSPPRDLQDRILPEAPLYRLTLSLLVGQDTEEIRPAAQQPRWQAQEAAQRFIFPVLERLQKVADFKVHYQIKSHVDLGQRPVADEKGGMFILEEDKLPVFIDENRWNVASSTDRATPIEFVVFLPPRSVQPLKVMARGEPKEGFGYKQWGAIYVMNSGTGDVIDVEQLRPAFSFFAGQLKQLFPTSVTVSEQEEQELSVDMPSDETTGISAIELDALRHRTILRRFASVIATLQALQRLLAQNSEIAVLPAIRTLIAHCLASLASAARSLSLGDPDLAVRMSSEASQFGDAAFFHPTMMAHQYFPQEHKLGVYMPLFFPFVLPVATASLAAFSQWMRSRLRRKQG